MNFAKYCIRSELKKRSSLQEHPNVLPKRKHTAAHQIVNYKHSRAHCKTDYCVTNSTKTLSTRAATWRNTELTKQIIEYETILVQIINTNAKPSWEKLRMSITQKNTRPQLKKTNPI